MPNSILICVKDKIMNRISCFLYLDTNNKGWLNREYRLMQLRQEIIDRVGDFNLDVKCPDGEILKVLCNILLY